MERLTDTLTYKNAADKIVFELDRIAADVESDEMEFSLTVIDSESVFDNSLVFDLSREDLEILQRVVKDALDNKV